ncbi:MAG: hypothetical protein F6K36_11125 [Symploca sp. SIO3C6]|uniref:Uncharacterized protein n=1 Tax=Symploca sp. SIO1C4 TaxID=2607765 RepID=A0A6B3NEZ0_9CYAN|nr:hypothetical protein [Symploca sp. SIO3C6]NER30197.1 hypothetical protein [Symploca sp. SIO1C4]NET08476.1 hypothetical protein [Symploca sp. SIO2B6]
MDWIVIFYGISAVFAAVTVIYVAYITYAEVLDWFKGRISKTNSKDQIGKTIVKARQDGKYSVRRIIIEDHWEQEESEIIADSVDQKLKDIGNKGNKERTYED